MIQEQLAFLPEFLSDYRPFPPAKERTAWQGLPLRAKQRFLQAGEAALQTPIAPLPLSLWLDFTRTGRRAAWEDTYFSRRVRLCALVSAECVEHKGRFLDAIADTVWALCEESAWQLPAHNSYIRDTPQLPLPDTTRPIVDLFAAETGALLALARYLLPDELVHPECAAHRFSAAHHAAAAKRCRQTGSVQSRLLFKGLRRGRLLQRGCAVLPPRRADPVGLP